MRFIAGYAELYGECAWFCSALKQMKEGDAAVNWFDAPSRGNAPVSISATWQYVAVQNEQSKFVPTKVRGETS
jgi:hypothetical protein